MTSWLTSAIAKGEQLAAVAANQAVGLLEQADASTAKATEELSKRLGTPQVQPPTPLLR